MTQLFSELCREIRPVVPAEPFQLLQFVTRSDKYPPPAAQRILHTDGGAQQKTALRLFLRSKSISGGAPGCYLL